MIHRKSLFAWEQVCRVFLGLMLAVAAWRALSAGMLHDGLIASGIRLVTADVVGLCPVCAMVGRRPVVPGPAVARS